MDALQSGESLRILFPSVHFLCLPSMNSRVREWRDVLSAERRVPFKCPALLSVRDHSHACRHAGQRVI